VREILGVAFVPLQEEVGGADQGGG
jgi:hypothetical protein